MTASALALVSTRAADAAAPPVVSASVGTPAADAALTQVGKPYEWGSRSPARGFDSPGLVVWAFGRVGVRALEQYPQALWQDGVHVGRGDRRVGDLVFFEPQHSHVGIYLGAGRYVHAPHTGPAVRVDRLGVGELAGHYSGAVRLFRSAARR